MQLLLCIAKIQKVCGIAIRQFLFLTFLSASSTFALVMTDEAEQEFHGTVDTVAAYVETEVVVAGIVALTSRVGLGVELAGVVVVLDEYPCFVLVDMIEFHDSLYALRHGSMKENAEFVGMVFKDMEATASDDDTRFLLGYFSHRLGLCVEELPGGDVVGGWCVFADADEVLIELGEVFPPGRPFLLQADGFLFGEVEFLGDGFQYLLVNELDIQAPCQLCADFVSACSELAVDGDDVLVVEIHSVGL